MNIILTCLAIAAMLNIGPCRVKHLFSLFQMSHMEAFTLMSAFWSCYCCEKCSWLHMCLWVIPHTQFSVPSAKHLFQKWFPNLKAIVIFYTYFVTFPPIKTPAGLYTESKQKWQIAKVNLAELFGNRSRKAYDTLEVEKIDAMLLV